MAKGGRYLKKKQKKGRGWKIALTVLAVLVVLIGCAAFAAVRYYNSLLSRINRAEYEDKGASVEDILDAATYNPDKYTQSTEEATETTTETTSYTDASSEQTETTTSAAQ